MTPTHTYAITGTFTVSLTVIGPGGSDKEVKTDCVTVIDGERVYLPAVLRDY